MKKFFSSVMTLVFAIAAISCGGNTNNDSRTPQQLSGAGAVAMAGVLAAI